MVTLNFGGWRRSGFTRYWRHNPEYFIVMKMTRFEQTAGIAMKTRQVNWLKTSVVGSVIDMDSRSTRAARGGSREHEAAPAAKQK